MSNPPVGRVLAIDYGTRRIGLAVSDPLGITAQPLPARLREGNKKDVEAIAAVAAEREVARIVFGLPLHMSGDEGKMAEAARKFVALLVERTGLPADPYDERLSSVAVERHLIDAGVSREKRKEVRDSLSAVLILQGYLAHPSTCRSAAP